MMSGITGEEEMKVQAKLAIRCSGAALVASALAACTAVGPLETDTVRVDGEGAASVAVHIDMGAGRLDVESGGDALMLGEFTTNVAAWKPEVSYRVEEERGTLRVRQRGGGNFTAGRTRNEWLLRFGEDLPLAMTVDLGAGEAELELGELLLESLDLDVGAGRAVVDLTEVRDWDLRVEVDGGVGQTVLLLPARVGVRARVSKGIGAVNTEGMARGEEGYVNRAYGQTEGSVEVSVSTGVGEIRLEIIDPVGVFQEPDKDI